MVGTALVLQYEGVLDYEIVFIAGIIAITISIGFKKIDLTQFVGLAASAAAAAVLRGGDRNTAICTNDLQLAFVYDARHTAWHINTAVLLWQAIGILSDQARDRAAEVALAAAIPAVAVAVDEYSVYFEAWVASLATSVAAILWLAVAQPTSKYTLL